MEEELKQEEEIQSTQDYTEKVENEEKEEETALCDATESPVKRGRKKKVVEDVVINRYGVEVSLEGADVCEFEEDGKKWRKYTRNGSFVHIEEAPNK